MPCYNQDKNLIEMKNRLPLILITVSIIALASIVAFVLFRLSQGGGNLPVLVVGLSILAIVALLLIGYWLLSHLLPLISQSRTLQKHAPGMPGKISKETINGASKQPDSVEWVKQQYPDALIMGAEALVKEYKTGRRKFQNVYPAAAGPYETYLKWTTLDSADFSRAVLYRAPLDGTSLIGANLNGAYLEGASLKGAILRHADLSWADLSGANLSGADLTGANLSYASLNGVDLSKAILARTIVTPEQLESTRSLEGAILPDDTQNQ